MKLLCWCKSWKHNQVLIDKINVNLINILRKLACLRNKSNSIRKICISAHPTWYRKKKRAFEGYRRIMKVEMQGDSRDNKTAAKATIEVLFKFK